MQPFLKAIALFWGDCLEMILGRLSMICSLTRLISIQSTN